MPESEKRELGGLARSIDALFSQPRPAPVAEEPLDEGEAVDSGPPAEAMADPFEAAAGPLELDPDPFDSLGAHTGDEVADVVEDAGTEPIPEPVEAPSPELSFADVDVPQEVVWEPAQPEAAGSEPDEMAAPEIVSTPAEPVSQMPDPEPIEPEAPIADEPAGPSLGELVEAYLAGDANAAEAVRSEATSLQERLALDPLADAVEALAHSRGDDPTPEDLALAQDVINPAVASRLVQRLGHEEDEDKRRGYVVLSDRLGTVMAKAFRGALTDATDPRARRSFYDALIAMGDATRPMIEEMVEDDNRFLVRNAVAILGETGGERAVELVTSALANTDARVRREALHSLARLGGEESGPLVLGLLEDPDAAVRAAAAGAAGALKVERALKPILGLLEDEDDPEVLVELLGGLGSLGDPGAVQAIEKRAVGSLFSKPVTEVRVAAYRALHDIGTPHARDVIGKAKDDKDPVVRTMARQLAATA